MSRDKTSRVILRQRWLNAALSAITAITAAVVGVVLNLAAWFSLHTLFGEVHLITFHGLRLQIPDLTTINVASCVVAVLAALMTFYWKKGIVMTLAISAVVGTTWYLAPL